MNTENAYAAAATPTDGTGSRPTARRRMEGRVCPRFGRAPRGYLLHSPPGNSLTPVRATQHPTRRRGDRRQTYPSTTRSATTCKEIKFKQAGTSSDAKERRRQMENRQTRRTRESKASIPMVTGPMVTQATLWSQDHRVQRQNPPCSALCAPITRLRAPIVLMLLHRGLPAATTLATTPSAPPAISLVVCTTRKRAWGK